jgi:hypothetical protein
MTRRHLKPCPICGTDSKVVQTDYLPDGTVIRRRRCLDREGCGHLWYTQQPSETSIDLWRLSWLHGGRVVAIRPEP